MSVELWAVRLERPLTVEEAERMLEALPARRRNGGRQPQPEALCAYALLQRAAKEQYQWQTLPEIAYGPLGKPWFPDFPEVHFNISHTAGAVLVGLAERPVGVDIERVRNVPSRLARRIGAEGTAFFETWVRWEARAKRTGAGIVSMLDGEPPLEEGEQYRRLNVFSGYAAGVAVSDGEQIRRIRRYTVDELEMVKPHGVSDSVC